METIVNTKKNHEFEIFLDSLKIIVLSWLLRGFHGLHMVFHCFSLSVQSVQAPDHEITVKSKNNHES